MTEQDEQGRKVIAAIERMLASDEEILGVVEAAKSRTSSTSEAAWWLARRYARASALAGGAAAAPSFVPGWGTLLSFGTMAGEMVYLLKVEVEMCLALVALYGMDLRNTYHRNVAFLLAATTTHEATTGRPLVVDLADAGLEALVSYSPRELGKVVISFFGKMAVHLAGQYAGRSLVRALPLVSVGVGAGVN
ncbi:MAG: hypothetical protein RIF41_34215, partial [Polyangiaceae bacterium]